MVQDLGFLLEVKILLNNSRKGSKSIMKLKGIVVYVLLAAIVLMGCSKQVNESDSNLPGEDIQANVEKENNIPKDITNEDINENINNQDLPAEVFNNGGLYVKYNGNVYYRQYTADSYAPEGIFGVYEAIPGVKKNMIRMSQDGTKEKAFSDTGIGNIYIYQDKMYLGKVNEFYIPVVYAVDLDGSNEQEIGTGWIEGIDEVSGTLICTLVNDSNTYQLHKLDIATSELNEYDLEVPCAEVLAIREGVIYYSGEVDFEDSVKGKIKFSRVNIDGTKEMLLAETDTDLYEYGDRGTRITCIQFVEETIYFSYGAYGGTGNFYQGGRIAKVNINGSEFKILLGDVVGEEAYDYDLTEDTFYVVSENGLNVLYYTLLFDSNVSLGLNLSTGEIKETDFPIYAEGKPFVYENSVRIYLKASSSMTTWIPYIDFNYLGLEEEADYYTIKDIELSDNWVYYRIEANKNAPEASIGWRDGYRRIRTKIMRQELEKKETEILFEY